MLSLDPEIERCPQPIAQGFDLRHRRRQALRQMPEDQLRILAATKKAWGDRVTTVFPRQGKFANDPEVLAAYPPADVTVERIGDLLSYGPSDLRAV